MSVNYRELTQTITPNRAVVPQVVAAAALTSAVPSPASLVVFNATTVDVTTISIGGVVVTPTAGMAGFSSTQGPSSCTCSVTASTPSISVAFGSNGWQSTVLIGQLTSPLYIWCYSNGFVVTTAAGDLAQVSFWTP